MADIFISYAKKDRLYAEELAKFLDELGLTSWWDANLVGGQNFRERITDEVTQAKATIVIWSPSSIKSAFVIDEADLARQSAKLISVIVPGFQADKIPIGFRGSQIVSIGDGGEVVQALIAAGVSDIKRTGSYLLGIFAKQIKAIERNSRKTQRLALATLGAVLFAAAAFAASQWLLRPSLIVSTATTINRGARYSDNLDIYASTSLYFRNTSEVARLFAPSYTVREYDVFLYGKTFQRLTREPAAKNMRVTYGSAASPQSSFRFVFPREPGAEFFVVVCASLSKGTDDVVSIRIGKAERYRDYERLDDFGILSSLDISEGQIETLQRDSGCELSSSTIIFP